MKTAVVIGVGPLRGLGASLCRAAAAEGLHVVAAGRSRTRLEAVVEAVKAAGGEATAMPCDATDEAQVVALLSGAEAIGPVVLAIYNAGNNMPGSFLVGPLRHQSLINRDH